MEKERRDTEMKQRELEWREKYRDRDKEADFALQQRLAQYQTQANEYPERLQEAREEGDRSKSEAKVRNKDLEEANAKLLVQAQQLEELNEARRKRDDAKQKLREE